MMNKEKKLERALKYAMSLVAFQEVGMGPDENLGRVNGVVHVICELCEKETGYDISSDGNYPVKFLKDNAKTCKNLQQFHTLRKISEGEFD